MKRQKPFEPVEIYSGRDVGIEHIRQRLETATSLDYAALIAHVIIQELLLELLAVRLRTDTLPTRVPAFETLCGLALAGSKYEREREILTLLNVARNTIGHKTHRENVGQQLADFSRLALDTHDRFDFVWSQDEKVCIGTFVLAVIAFSSHIIEIEYHFSPNGPWTAIAAIARGTAG